MAGNIRLKLLHDLLRGEFFQEQHIIFPCFNYLAGLDL
jgi:hypothetical protein